jgi:glycosyltransferase involved in cell wall biosynthesis
MMDKKIKVLCVPSDKGGCGLHRSLKPHLKLDELYSNEFDVTIEYKPNWSDLDKLKEYDIIHFHKGLYADKENFNNALSFCKSNNIVTVMDIDDHWEVGQFHPHFIHNKRFKTADIIKNNLRMADYVTTTTPLFANEIKKYNKNVKVFVNALDVKEMQELQDNVNKTGKLRVGFVMGSTHKHDMELVRGLTNRLPKEIIEKTQFVLCGYDLRGTVTEISPNGEIKQRDMRPEEIVWFDYEKNITDNYKIVSPEHKDFLLKFIPQTDYPLSDNESYKRCWTKVLDNFEYMKHYNNLDVLLVPLQENHFNYHKSELKFVEAGMMNVAVVASNFGPYTVGSKSFFQKGGLIDESGNCILIDNKKAHKEWAKTIEKLVKNPEYVEKLKINMNKHVVENYDIDKITAMRAEWYKEICRKNG